jgi:two-component system, cell cycle sensor histidine kinase and response regulator CckA
MKFLIIDDNPYDRELIIRSLTHIFAEAIYVEIIDNISFEKACQTLDYTIIFTDFQLKWTTGLDILKTIRLKDTDLPVIMITDTGSEEIATEAMKNGLDDYLLKTHLTRLPIAVQECLAKVHMRTEHRQLEIQLQKAQKMESLGLLVSGIAHDFNNTLAAIMGYSQIGMLQIPPQHPLAENFQHIHDRAEQGARMTRQLLAFARGMPLAPSQISLNELLLSLQDFLCKLLGSNIELSIQSEPELYNIYADRTQLEQVLVNLCLNARDAMPTGGVLSIATKNSERESTMPPSSQVNPPPGFYAILTVTDTGVGMDEQTQGRLFEPFFTTKDVGQGTGLGLAVVYGIMKQHHGFVQVQSEKGKGTAFTLSFPATKVKEELNLVSFPTKHEAQGGSETILLVEDDPDIQLLISEFLQSCGYTLILASNGEEGMQLFEQYASSIALVIADVMMPKMTGKEFQMHIRKNYPAVRILIVSGYQKMDLQRRELLDPASAFLQKPFGLDELEAKVREINETQSEI